MSKLIVQSKWQAGFVTEKYFFVSSALDCSFYRWRLFVYFTFPSTWLVNKILKSNQTEGDIK